VKAIAKGIVAVYDNLDALAGMAERVFLLLMAELLRRGAWFSALLLCILVLILWFWKITRKQPGPLVSFVRRDPGQVRARLVSLTKTVYKA